MKKETITINPKRKMEFVFGSFLGFQKKVLSSLPSDFFLHLLEKRINFEVDSPTPKSYTLCACLLATSLDFVLFVGEKYQKYSKIEMFLLIQFKFYGFVHHIHLARVCYPSHTVVFQPVVLCLLIPTIYGGGWEFVHANWGYSSFS